MEKKMIVAIALSLLVLFAFQKMNPANKQRQAMPQQAEQSEQMNQSSVHGEDRYDSEQTYDTYPEEAKNVIPEGGKDITIETNQYILKFSNMGGSLKEIILKEYSNDENVETIFMMNEPGKRLFDIRSNLGSNLNSKIFKAEQSENTLYFTYEEPGRAIIKKTYTFYNSLDYIDLSVSVENLSNQTTPFSYKITGPTELRETGHITGRNFLQAVAMVNGELWKAKAKNQPQQKTGQISWVAIKNRYYAIALNPLEDAGMVTITESGAKNIMTQLSRATVSLSPGETAVSKYVLYAGPLKENRLGTLGPEFHQLIDYGFFGAVSKVLLKILDFFHGWTNNWGGAIILLTLLINLILFPLTMKSFTSMQQMKKIQPHIQKLRELHKDNPQKLNKETMALYKQYNVNPLGGCLPMILQMPIFIALYQGLMRSIELKGATFLWIKDLAKPDAVPLPFSLPAIGNHINILPLFMAGMMIVQQKLSQGAGAGTPEQASQQKMMMMFMPLFFGFLFYNMPSGLVLYWLTNTILMTSEQALISKRMNRS